MSGSALDAPVVLSTAGAVATVMLNRPAKLNAMSPDLMAGLEQALDAVDASPARVVVLTGAGRAFSTGGDLTVFRRLLESESFDEILDSVRRNSATLSRVARLPQVVIGAVNGLAVAGGLELLLCCDLVVAARGALIGDGHIQYCVLPGGGSSVRLGQRVAPGLARRLLLSGELLPAEELVAAGLVQKVVPPAELAREAARLALELAELSPLAVRSMKRLISDDDHVQSMLALELDAFARHIRSHDFREGLSAFFEKRRPDYRGD